MTYFIIFALSFLLGIWVKVSGEVVKLDLSHYTIIADLYFIIFTSVALLFLLTIFTRLLLSISSTFINIKNRRRGKEELLLFEILFSLDLGDVENAQKLIKNLNEESDKLLLIKTFNAGKTGNYNFFTNNLISIASKNRNLALLVSHKLIASLKKDKITFQKFVEYCSHSINDKVLSIPFQIEYFIIKEDWNNAIIKLKEAVRYNIFLPFDQREVFAIFYCALARQYESKGNLKDAIKSVFRAQSHHRAFQPINYLKAELYVKLGKLRKASAILETEYKINPNPQVAKLYISLNPDGAERLHNLSPDYNCSSEYKTSSDSHWSCKSCNKLHERWEHACSSCKDFNCIVIY
ncbi:MAG: hypothetical protein PG981_000585 [Wolbachia endosymbiont of Ctenocephalides orientis wCori]|nr:MAG: hypothetical protein PG981_000585 [Wolbachia endosymbiont of Ctenocephalides orientis wCori]